MNPGDALPTQTYVVTRGDLVVTVTATGALAMHAVSLRRRGLATYLREQFGELTWRAVQAGLVLAYLVFSVFTVTSWWSVSALWSF